MLVTSPAASPLQQVRSTRLAAMQSTVLVNLQASMCHHFTLFFNAAKAKAFTTFLAGLALTFTNSPNAMRLPAFVAGLYVLDHADTRNGELTSAFHLLASQLCQGIQDLRYLRPFLLASGTHSIGNCTFCH